MRAPVLGIAAVLTAACSSNEPGLRTPASAPPAVIQSGSTTEVRLARDESVRERQVMAPMDSVFAAVRTLYRALGVPVQAESRRDGIIESGHFGVPRDFLDQPLAALLDCGHSITGARVTTWNVTMQMTTGMRPHPENGTLVATRIVASARPRDGTSTPPVTCNSTGRIEREVVERVAGRVVS